MAFKHSTRIILTVLLMMPLSCFATGLGDIQVQSNLNQPFNAVIPVIDIKNVPTNAVIAKLATEQQFNSVGLTKEPKLSNLSFNVMRNKQQQTYIQVTSTQPIQQPVLTFLLQLNWPGGQILREYTIFLDPASYTPGKTKKTSLQTQSINKSALSNSTVTKPRTYGPTTSNDNLWQIANQNLPASNISTTQMMIAIVKLNPHAFVKNNINGLKSGFILKLPTAAQAGVISVDESKAMINEQNQLWQNHTQTTVLPIPSNELSESSEQTSIPSAPAPFDDEADNVSSMPAKSASNNKSIPILSNTTMGQESDLVANQPNSASTIAALENEVNISTEAMRASAIANQSLQQEVKDLQLQVQTLQQQLIEKNNEITVLEKVHSEQDQARNITEVRQSTPWYWWLAILILMFASILSGAYSVHKKINLQNIKKFLQRFKNNSSQISIPLIETVSEQTDDSSKTTSVSQQEPIAPTASVSTPVISNSSMLDIVDEADVYIAYGRYEKAETLIKSSLVTNPEQPELRFKLLEIYFAQKNRTLFDEEINFLSLLPELSPILQNKITALTARWESGESTTALSGNYQSTASTLVAATEQNTEADYLNEEHTSAIEHSSRVIEFDGDLGTLYTSTTETLNKEPSVTADSENIYDSLQLEERTNTEISGVVSDKDDTSAHVQTNLDLAKTYYDMGDFVEALNILQTILPHTNETQKRIVQDLIDHINER